MLSEQSVDALRMAVRNERYRDGGLRRLARVAGVSYSWLTKFATGRTRNEKIDMLRRISRVVTPGAHGLAQQRVVVPARAARSDAAAVALQTRTPVLARGPDRRGADSTSAAASSGPSQHERPRLTLRPRSPLA
jgi:transcriptional regulator with XRE-family HTH domain